MANESISKTFGVAAGVCVVCAIVVSIASVALKGMQDANKQLDKNVNVLRAAGLIQPGEKVGAARVNELFANAKRLVVDTATGAIEQDADPDAVERDRSNVITLEKQDDIAQIKTIPAKTVVYLFSDEKGAPQSVVLPIVGSGLWSIMHGYLALNGDLSAVNNIVFYDHGETPGLGGEISNPVWTAKWIGKKAFDEDGHPALKVVKGTADPESSNVDGISGATLTGNGVTNTVQFWLGPHGFKPFLDNLKSASVNDAAEVEDQVGEEQQ